MRILLTLIIFAFCFAQASAHDPQYVYVKDFFESGRGADLNAVELETREIRPNLYALIASGGNAGSMLVSIGPDGTLVVDTMYAPIVPKIKKAILDLGGGDIDFAINTHFHFDHADGNPLLSEDGTHIVAHSKARRSMTEETKINLVKLGFIQPPYPKDSLPVMSFDKDMQMHFNGETIKLMHFAPAHTSGDAVVYFKRANVMHMGDVFNNDGYPFIDTNNGGDLDGMIKFCKEVLAVINKDTIVFPGHGEPMSYDQLSNHIGMLETVRTRISKMVEKGYSLEKVLAAKPTEDFDALYNHPSLAADPRIFIDRIYDNLTNPNQE